MDARAKRPQDDDARASDATNSKRASGAAGSSPKSPQANKSPTSQASSTSPASPKSPASPTSSPKDSRKNARGTSRNAAASGARPTSSSPLPKGAPNAAHGGSAPRAGLQPASGGDATRVTIRAQPGASRTGFAGLWNGMPKIAVTAPPENGRANDEIAAELARLFGLRAAQVTQVSGATSRAKVFQLEIPPARVAARLDELVRAAEEAAAKRDERREDKKN